MTDTTDKNEKAIVIKNPTQLEIFRMKFKGFTYEQIEAKFEKKYTARTLELYFYKGGRWHDAYVAWRDFQAQQIKDTMNDMFISQAIEANQQISNLSRGKIFVTVPSMKEGEPDTVVPLSVKPEVILNAAKDILDRAGFKAAEKADSSQSDDLAEKITKHFEAKAAERLAEKKKVKK